MLGMTSYARHHAVLAKPTALTLRAKFLKIYFRDNRAIKKINFLYYENGRGFALNLIEGI